MRLTLTMHIAHLASAFQMLIEVLDKAFCSTMSEEQYTIMLTKVQQYQHLRDSLPIDAKTEVLGFQRQCLADQEWPLTYDPTEHIHSLRYACALGSQVNQELNHKLNELEICLETA